MRIIPKFVKGDLVQLSSDMGDSPCSGKKAIVLYDDTEHGNESKTEASYGLLIREYGTHQAWFCESDLSMIEARRIDLISQFEEQRDKKYEEGRKEDEKRSKEFMNKLLLESIEECKIKGLDVSSAGKILAKKVAKKEEESLKSFLSKIQN